MRPTSETIIGEYIAKWIQSLPRPAAAAQPVGQRGALGAAATALPAHHRVPLAGGPHRSRHRAEAARGRPAHPLEVYAALHGRDVLAIPVLLGRKSAGSGSPAPNTLTSGVMGHGKVAAMGSSHELAHNFASRLRQLLHLGAAAPQPCDHLAGAPPLGWSAASSCATATTTGCAYRRPSHPSGAGHLRQGHPRGADAPRRWSTTCGVPACRPSSTTASTSLSPSEPWSTSARVSGTLVIGPWNCPTTRLSRPGARTHRGPRPPRPTPWRSQRLRSLSRTSAARRARASAWPTVTVHVSSRSGGGRGAPGRVGPYRLVPAGPEGEARLAEHGVTVRCLQTATPGTRA